MLANTGFAEPIVPEGSWGAFSRFTTGLLSKAVSPRFRADALTSFPVAGIVKKSPLVPQRQVGALFTVVSGVLQGAVDERKRA